VKKTLFLNPPSFEGFDGGAGARYPAKREITSYWYPTWLAQPAALVSGSRLVDAPPHHLTLEDILQIAADYELILIYTSTPSLTNDIRCIDALKAQDPQVQMGLIGAHVTILPAQTLQRVPSIDFVCRGEFDFTCLELAQNKPYDQIGGLSYRKKDGSVHHTPDRELLEDLDRLPSVFQVYDRDLAIEK